LSGIQSDIVFTCQVSEKSAIWFRGNRHTSPREYGIAVLCTKCLRAFLQWKSCRFVVAST